MVWVWIYSHSTRTAHLPRLTKGWPWLYMISMQLMVICGNVPQLQQSLVLAAQLGEVCLGLGIRRSAQLCQVTSIESRSSHKLQRLLAERRLNRGRLHQSLTFLLPGRYYPWWWGCWMTAVCASRSRWPSLVIFVYVGSLQHHNQRKIQRAWHSSHQQYPNLYDKLWTCI